MNCLRISFLILSEDNTIRKLAKERGRNRYAGAGASMLIYPYYDIRNFIALKWAKQCVSKQWLVYDERYKEMCRENEKVREEGLSVKEQPLPEFYVKQIETDAKHDVPFAKSIVRLSGVYSNGVTRTTDKWKQYVAAIINKIVLDLEDVSSDLDSKQDDARQCISSLSNDWEEYVSAFAALEEYRLLSNAYVEEVSHTIAYSLFKGSGSGTSEGQDYRLESYLVNTENHFIHPNAIRYILIKILDLFKKQKENADREKTELKEFFDQFEKKKKKYF